jgi:hypothetical protein
MGNLQYEPGDRLAGDSEFIHVFSSEDEMRPEFEEGGFEVVTIQTSRESRVGGAVLRKPGEKSVTRDA